MYEEEHKSLGEKFKDFLYWIVTVIGLCIICGLAAYFLLGGYKKPIHTIKQKTATISKKTSEEVESLVINNDFKEPAHVVVINENGLISFEYYGIINTTEKDGQTNIIIDVRENEE